MANRYRGTLYVGVTGNLWSCVWDHKNGTTPGFTSKHGLKIFVWYEHHRSKEFTIKREKQLKAWQRAWKVRLVETINANWADLHDVIDPLATLVETEAGPQPSLG